MRRMGGGRRNHGDDIDPREDLARGRGPSRRRPPVVDDFADDVDDGPLDVRLRDPEPIDHAGERGRDDDLFGDIDEALGVDAGAGGDERDDADGLFTGRLRDGPPARARGEERAAGWRDPVEPAIPDLGPDRTARWAWLAAILWVGGVSAFVLGFAGVPMGDFGVAVAAVGEIHPRLAIMWAAVAVAPLGLIWMSAVVARRARELKAETARVAAIVSRRTAGAQSDLLEGAVDVGGVDRRLAGARENAVAIETAIEAAEERARAMIEALEVEREALSTAFATISGDARGAADGLAERVAALVAAQTGKASHAAGDARRAAPPEERAPQDAAPRAGGGGGGAVARATDAAIASFGDGVWADEQGGAEDGADDGSGRLNALRRRIGRRAARARETTEPRAAAAERPAPQPAPPPQRAPQPSPEIERAPPIARDGDARPAPRRNGLNWDKLIRAANFPDSEDDRETLDALYAVLTDPEAAALLQAAEDTLSALADIGLFMEDLKPQHAPAERWRSYILDGDRAAARDLGGVRDESALDDVSVALDDRPTFRDASSRFVDRYERMLERIFDEASDPAIAVELADTRSGRAYMLLGRASGRFA